MSEAPAESEQLVNALVEVWNERQYSRIPDLVSQSFVMYDPGAPEGEVHGPDGLAAFMRDIVGGFPDFHVSVDRMLSSDELVMYEGTMTMTHEGEFNGIPPTGRHVEIGEMSRYTVEDGNIQEHQVYFDKQAVLEQLGFTAE
jgi:steroid delta-isomerase-like uncharacterized protein